MRVTSDFFVSALIRRVSSGGGFATIVNKGAAEAGAILIVLRGRLGVTALYGPAPQTAYGEGRPDDRVFALLLEGDEPEVDARLAKERRFDPDIWIVELEIELAQLGALVTLQPAERT